MKNQKQASIDSVAKEKQDIAALQEIKQGLQEQVIKEFKGIEMKNLTKVTRSVLSNGNETVGHFLLDSLTQFITGNAAATFTSNGKDFFADRDTLEGNIRKIDHLLLDKKQVESIMERISGKNGKPEEGDIFSTIASDKDVAHYIDFFPFFRVLSKTCHLAFTKRKEAAHIRKEKRSTADLKKKDVEIETQEVIQQQLAFYETLQNEAQRIRSSEIKIFQEKLQTVTNKLAELNDRLSRFESDFWAGAL